MLKDALESLHTFVFKENGDAKDNDEIQDKLNSLESEYKVKPEIDLAQYHFLFSKLKMEILEKELRDKNKKNAKKSTRSGKDWMPAERSILWFYINQAQEIEGLKYSEAEENIAIILDKSTSGIRYKYYEIKKSVDKGENLQEVLNKTRKGKSADKATKKATVKATTKVKAKDTTKAKTTAVEASETGATETKRRGPGRPKKVESVEATAKAVTETKRRGPGRPSKAQPVEATAPVVTTEPKVVKETVTTEPKVEKTLPTEPKAKETVVRNSEETPVQTPIFETEATKTENPSGLSENYRSEYVTPEIKNKEEERGTFSILSSLVNNFRIVGEQAPHLNAAEDFKNLLLGLESLAILAASNAHNSSRQNDLENEVAELKKELAKEKEASQLLAQDFKTLKKENEMLAEEYGRKAEQRNKSIEEAFKVFKNTHNHFFNLSEDNQLVQYQDFQKRVKLQIENMDEAINKSKEIGFNASNSRRFRIDMKDGLLTKTV